VLLVVGFVQSQAAAAGDGVWGGAEFAVGSGAGESLAARGAGEHELVEPGDPGEFVHDGGVAEVELFAGEQLCLGGGEACWVGVCGQRQWLGHR